jgi:hypothetical protein
MNNYALVYFAGLVISLALFYLPPKWLEADLKDVRANIVKDYPDASSGLLAFTFAFLYVSSSILWFIFWPLYIKDGCIK